MLTWGQFQREEAELSQAATRLLSQNEVAFLPFVPKIVEGRLVAFIMDTSPKLADLETRKQYAIHLLPGDEDEQFYISGVASNINEDMELRQDAEVAMGFATGVDEHHILYEFKLERALWTRWLDFGTPDHRPSQKLWIHESDD